MAFLRYTFEKNEQHHKRFFQNVALKAKAREDDVLPELRMIFLEGREPSEIYFSVMEMGYFD